MKSPFLFFFWNLYFFQQNLQRQVILNPDLSCLPFSQSSVSCRRTFSLQHHTWKLLIQIQEVSILLYNLDVLNHIVLRLRRSCLFVHVATTQAEAQNAFPSALQSTVPEGNGQVVKCPACVWGQAISFMLTHRHLLPGGDELHFLKRILLCPV